MEARSRDIVNCPHCSAENPVNESSCGACSRGLTLYIGPANTFPRRFGLGSLMVLVAVVAIGLGVFRASPGLGVLVLYLFTPAMIRTSGVASQRADDERPMTLEEKSWVFLSSIGLMFSVLVASSTAFMAVRVPSVAVTGGYDLFLAWGVSGAVALLVGLSILRKFWPYCH